jgi:glutamine synthetase adenylyltransferase
LSDIEYIAHYILLAGEKQPNKVIGKSIPEILRYFKSNKKVLNELAYNYIFLKKIEIFNQLGLSISSSKIAEDVKRLNKLARLMRIENGSVLKKKLNSTLQFNRETFSEFFKTK